jgi:hypothetical protein
MQLQRVKCHAQNRLHSLLHKTLALESGKDVVTKIAAAKRSEDHVRNVDDADNGIAMHLAYERSGVFRFADSLDKSSKLLW